MTDDPYRVNEEYAELENELTNLVQEWRRKEKNKRLEEYERKAYGHAANQLENAVRPNMAPSNNKPTENEDGEDEVDRMLMQLKREAKEMEDAAGLHAHKMGIMYAVEMIEEAKYGR